ncbi:MAG: ABC transporter permease [Candidatus Hodarchaeota archaeon]
MKKHVRVIIATTRYNLIAFYRVFSLTSFALRFFLPFMTMAAAWILYHAVFGSKNLKTTFSSYSSVDYLTFVIIGQAVFVYIYATVFLVGRVFYWERMGGTIEPLFLSPVSRRVYMLGQVCFAMFNATIDFLIILVAGTLVFRARITYLNILLLTLGIAMTVISLFGVGLVVNGVTLSLRDRTNTANILTSVFFIFSGAIAPVEMLPGWGRIIGQLIPLTYSLKIIRGSIVVGMSIKDFIGELFSLVLISILLLVIGLIFLARMERSLKSKGEMTAF